MHRIWTQGAVACQKGRPLTIVLSVGVGMDCSWRRLKKHVSSISSISYLTCQTIWIHHAQPKLLPLYFWISYWWYHWYCYFWVQTSWYVDWAHFLTLFARSCRLETSLQSWIEPEATKNFGHSFFITYWNWCALVRQGQISIQSIERSLIKGTYKERYLENTAQTLKSHRKVRKKVRSTLPFVIRRPWACSPRFKYIHRAAGSQ